MSFKKTINFVLVLFVFSFVFSQKAQAYIDPGSGSMVIQMILAAIFGFICTFKLWAQKILNFLKFKKKDKNED